MRALLFSLMFATLFITLPSTDAKAQTVADILKDTWNGYTEFEASYTTSGKGFIYQTVTFSVNSFNNISGTMKATVTIDGSKYVCYSTVSGKVYEDVHEVYFYAAINDGADVLPYGLQWCEASGTLTMYTDEEKNGYYILNGNLKDACTGEAIELTLSNY